MAGGPSPLGFAYFAGVKAVGYTAAAAVLKRGYGLASQPRPAVWSVGLTRTAIGIAAGLLYGGAWIWVIGRFFTNFSGTWEAILYFAFLLPIRFAEWSLLIWIFFDRGLHDRIRQWQYAGFGILCSYVLDAIGIGAAVIIPGGVWVC